MGEVSGDADRLKQADARSYDATASEFDVLTDRYSTAIAARMLHIADVGQGARLLDLGTGTGLLARLAAERGANVVGIDHSEGMLGRARAKSEAAGLADRTTFKAMDAEALQLEGGSFDVVASLYVLRHLPNPQAAIREMHRVLRPGGRLIAAVGARPSPLSTDGVGAATDRVMAAMGRRALSPTYLRNFLDEEDVPPSKGHAAHHGNGDVGGMLSAAGFRSLRQTWWSERYLLLPQEFWDVQAVFDSEARERLTSLPDARVAELKQRFIEEGQTLTKRGVSLVYRTGAAIYSAER
jgi:ubiquinone/menaquinone biosynthesis C-methylase UbiE